MVTVETVHNTNMLYLSQIEIESFNFTQQSPQ